MEGQGRPILGPQPVGDPVGLQRLKALEEQKGLQIAPARCVALDHGPQVGLDLGQQRRIRGIGLVGHFAHAHGAHFLVAELARHLVGQGGG